jgi:hypothetical protein
MNFLKKLFGSSSEKEQSDSQSQPLPQPTATFDPLEKYKSIHWMTDRRLENVSMCLAAGFKPASSLPTDLRT